MRQINHRKPRCHSQFRWSFLLTITQRLTFNGINYMDLNFSHTALHISKFENILRMSICCLYKCDYVYMIVTGIPFSKWYVQRLATITIRYLNTFDKILNQSLHPNTWHIWTIQHSLSIYKMQMRIYSFTACHIPQIVENHRKTLQRIAYIILYSFGCSVQLFN